MPADEQPEPYEAANESLRRRLQHAWDGVIAEMRRCAVVEEWVDDTTRDRAVVTGRLLAEVDADAVGQGLWGLLLDGSPHVRAVGAVVGAALAPFDDVADELAVAARSPHMGIVVAAVAALARVEGRRGLEVLLDLVRDSHVDALAAKHAMHAVRTHADRTDEDLEVCIARPDLDELDRALMVREVRDPGRRRQLIDRHRPAWERGDGVGVPMDMASQTTAWTYAEAGASAPDVAEIERRLDVLLRSWRLLGDGGAGLDEGGPPLGRYPRSEMELALELGCSAMAASSDPSRGEALRRLLQRDDIDDGQRLCVLQAMGSSRDRSLAADVARWCAPGHAPRLAQQAIWTLGQLGGGAALRALVPALQDDRQLVARAAAFALGRLCEPSPPPRPEVALPSLPDRFPAGSREAAAVEAALTRRLSAADLGTPTERGMAAQIVRALDGLAAVRPSSIEAAAAVAERLVAEQPLSQVALEAADPAARLLARSGTTAAPQRIGRMLERCCAAATAAGCHEDFLVWMRLEAIAKALAGVGPTALPEMARLLRQDLVRPEVASALRRGITGASAELERRARDLRAQRHGPRPHGPVPPEEGDGGAEGDDGSGGARRPGGPRRPSSGGPRAGGPGPRGRGDGRPGGGGAGLTW